MDRGTEKDLIWTNIEGGDKALGNREWVSLAIRNEQLDLVRLCHGSFKDVVFDNCTFRNIDWNNAILDDCYFQNCKLIGVSFTEVKGRNVTFHKCAMDGCDFNSSSWKGGGWIECKVESIFIADMTMAHCRMEGTNLILLGSDLRGYNYCAFSDAENRMHIRAGCRDFVGIGEARNHWEQRHRSNKDLLEQIRAILVSARKQGVGRGWAVG